MAQKSTLEVIGEVLCEYFKDRLPDENVIVELTQELYDHLVKMYDNTDWESLDDMPIIIPDYDGTLDNPDFRESIGEYIYMAQYGDAFDALSKEAFEEGMVIRTADDLFLEVGYDLDSYFNQGDDLRNAISNKLPLTVALALKNRFSTRQIIRNLKG